MDIIVLSEFRGFWQKTLACLIKNCLVYYDLGEMYVANHDFGRKTDHRL